LLPASPGCLAVLTSRQQLPGLLAADGAHSVALGLPSHDEARQLLARRLGEDRLAAEPRAADEIIEECARLPLALAIVAARASASPGFPLAALARQLSEGRGNLDAFVTGDPGSELRTAFSWSYDALTTEAGRLFRLLALHPGPEVTPDAAASIAGLPVRQARTLLAELARAHLADETAPDRYAQHDLLSAYAAELTQAHEPPSEQRAAVHRMLDHYLHTAHIANHAISSPCHPIVPAPAQPGATPQGLADLPAAVAWFTAERLVLLAMVERAAGAGFHVHSWQLAWSLTAFLDGQGRPHDLATAHRTALTAARQGGDQAGQSRAHHGLAMACNQMGGPDEAHRHLSSALDLCTKLGDRPGQARVHSGLALFLGQQARTAEAVGHALRALELYREAGYLGGQAKALNNAGWSYALLGDGQRALEYCEEGLRLLGELGDLHGQAVTLDSIGYAHQQLGHHRQAIDSYLSALGLLRQTGGRSVEAHTLICIGDNYRAVGDHAAARTSWREALVILDDLGHPDAQQLRTKLHALPAAR
jgi:hypothetical protein